MASSPLNADASWFKPTRAQQAAGGAVLVMPTPTGLHLAGRDLRPALRRPLLRWMRLVSCVAVTARLGRSLELRHYWRVALIAIDDDDATAIFVSMPRSSWDSAEGPWLLAPSESYYQLDPRCASTLVYQYL